VNFAGDLTENVDVCVSLLAGPESNAQAPVRTPESPASMSGNGLMDQVTVDEAWVNYRGQFIAPLEATVGKQYFSRAQGLLVDNDQEAIKAASLDWGAGDWSWSILLGMLDREQFHGATVEQPGGPLTSGQDNYNLVTLDWDIADTCGLDLSYLESGFNEEQGYSAGLEAGILGLDFYGEYSRLAKWPTGEDFNDKNGDDVKTDDEVCLDESDTAWLAGIRWSSEAVCLTGEYGQVDAGYALALPGSGWSALLGSAYGMYADRDVFNLPLSRLHPNAEVDPHDINWIDRPLFLDPTNIARGWHVSVVLPRLLGENTPVSLSYADGDAYDPEYLAWLDSGGTGSGNPAPDTWRDADRIWSVQIGRQLSEDVSANVLYGLRQVENVMAPDCCDEIQVVRAEVCVGF
jgi:hypothetical protein